MSEGAQTIPLASGRYEIRNPAQLGGGISGQVYDGWDNDLEQRVAIKVLAPGTAPDLALIEARTQRRLSDHRHIVTIRDVVVEPPQPFIIFDFIAGSSVRDHLDAGDVSLLDAVRWNRDGLAALTHAHSEGVHHRDYKPGNLLILDNGDAALSDFGLAEDTVRGVIADTRVYFPHVAPEVASRGTSELSDVWAVGCTLYRLLAGTYPFIDRTALATGTFVPVRQFNPQVPRRLEAVVETALDVDPATRFQSAREMREALLACRVVCGWERVADADTVECWQTDAGRGPLDVRLVEKDNGDVELTARRDLGRGRRRFASERPTSVARGRQRLYTWLRQTVEQGDLYL